MKAKHRDALRDTANLIGFSLGIYVGTSLLLQTVMRWVLDQFWLNDSLAPQLLVAVFNLLLAVSGLLLATAFLRKSTPKALAPKLNMTDPKDVRLWLFLPVFLGVGLLCSVLTSAVQALLEKQPNYTPPAAVQLPDGFLAMTLSFVTLCIVPAVLEEIFCRGLLQGMLRRWGVWFSILLSSAVFTLLHGDISRMPAIFVLSICLGLMAYITNSLMPSMILHFMNNAMSFILLCAAQKMKGVAALGMTIYLIVFFCFVAALCLYFVFKWKVLSSLQPIPRVQDKKNKQGRFGRIVASPAFLIMMLWLVVRALWPLLAKPA